jgi:hypothetical protein
LVWNGSWARRVAGLLRRARQAEFRHGLRLDAPILGTREIQHIQPNRVEVAQNVQNAQVSVRDAAYYGFYTYPHDAIGTHCGQVRLEIHSLKKKGAPEVKIVPARVFERIGTTSLPIGHHLEKDQSS